MGAMVKRFMGIDPGLSTGIVWGHASAAGKPAIDGIIQCSAPTAPFVVAAIVRDYTGEWHVEVEKWAPGKGAGEDADITRHIISTCKNFFYMLPDSPTYNERPAAMMKPWFTARKLKAVRFPLGAKFKDARDACGHMCYTACKDGGCKDPLY